jgi:predicted aspartyl protease
MQSKFAASLLAALITIATDAAAENDCQLLLAASLPITFEDGQIVVAAAIGNHPVKLIVDTGGTTLLKERVVKAIGLKHEALKNGQSATLFGGARLHRYAVAGDFALGSLRRGRVNILLLPDGARQDWKADGLLGANVLRDYDVDFDFAHAKLNLFLPHHCPGRAVYWTGDDRIVAKVPIEMSGDDIRVPVQIAGKEVKAILDTGANVTVMDQERYMPLFGLTPQSPGVEEYRVSGDAKPRYAYMFTALTFRGVMVNKVRVRFISRDYSRNSGYDMLLGMNVLRKLHLLVAYQEKMLYITSATQQ